MKVSQIAGFLGCGKTTFLIELVKILVNRGHRVAIIVNDIGDINVDVKFIERFGLKANELSGGCICCEIADSFANTLVVLYSTFNPDIVLVEPSGVAIPWGLKRAAEFSEADCDVKIVHAPVVTLVDSLRVDELFRTVHRLIETQIREADVVFINKIDEASKRNIELTAKFAKSINPNALIMYGSGRTRKGIEEVASLIENETSLRYDESHEEEILKKDYCSSKE